MSGATICFLATFFKFENHEYEHVATKCGVFSGYFYFAMISTWRALKTHKIYSLFHSSNKNLFQYGVKDFSHPIVFKGEFRQLLRDQHHKNKMKSKINHLSIYFIAQ